jgi:hypothetical protein
VLALLTHRVLHLRQHSVPPSAPFYLIFLPSGNPTSVTSTHITAMLRHSATALYLTLVLIPTMFPPTVYLLVVLYGPPLRSR